MEKVFHDYRKRSKEVWGQKFDENESLTIEQINLGAILRIADAVELMAKDRANLETTLAYYKRKTEELREELAATYRRLSAAKGQITKLKKSNDGKIKNR